MYHSTARRVALPFLIVLIDSRYFQTNVNLNHQSLEKESGGNKRYEVEKGRNKKGGGFRESKSDNERTPGSICRNI